MLLTLFFMYFQNRRKAIYMANPFTKNGANIEFSGEYMEAYIPEYYFNTNQRTI